MFSFWIVLIVLMADVMPRGHGGDGDDQPPPPRGFGQGLHGEDHVPPKKRGKAKNLKLRQEVDRHGGPLNMIFDRDATFTPVGGPNDLFVREVGMYMWQNMPFDKSSWKNVPAAEKNALWEHLAKYFDFDAVLSDRLSQDLKGGLEDVVRNRYTNRKAMAKQYFLDVGGYQDVEGARANPPEGMGRDNWMKAVDWFLTPEHKKASTRNKKNREEQQFVNRGGTSSYASTCYKKKLERKEAFRKAHTLPDGTWDSEIAEHHYQELDREYNEFETQNAGCPEAQADDVAIFEKVMGTRRGHVRGLGRKPPKATASSIHIQEPQSAPVFTEEYMEQLFQSEAFRSRMDRYYGKMKDTSVDNEDDEDDD